MLNEAILYDTTMTKAKNDFYGNIDILFERVFKLIDVPNMTLYQVTQALTKQNIKCPPEMISSIIQAKLDAYFHVYLCPKCNSKTQYKRKRIRKLYTTFGTIIINCPQFYCSKCRAYYSPYELALNLRSAPYQYDIQRIVAKLAAKQTFDETAKTIADIFGYNISADSVHKLTNEYANDVKLTEIIPTKNEIEKIIDELSKKQHRRPILVFAIDAARAPIRTEKNMPNEWKDVKGVRIYLLDKDHFIHLISWHQIAQKEQFQKFMEQIKNENLFPENKVRICCIADGASWIWDIVNNCFPNAQQVLDYFHCTQHLYKFASLKFPDEIKAKEWVDMTKVRLFHNQGKQIISGLKRMKCDNEEIRKERDKLIQYLSMNIHRINYGKAKRGNYPIGSGAIESANKFICHIRLKRSGAWWKIEKANNMLKLRCAEYNQKFDENFAKFEQKKRKPFAKPRPELKIVK